MSGNSPYDFHRVELELKNDLAESLRDRDKHGEATDVVFVDGKLKIVYQGAT